MQQQFARASTHIKWERVEGITCASGEMHMHFALAYNASATCTSTRQHKGRVTRLRKRKITGHYIPSPLETHPLGSNTRTLHPWPSS